MIDRTLLNRIVTENRIVVLLVLVYTTVPIGVKFNNFLIVLFLLFSVSFSWSKLRLPEWRDLQLFLPAILFLTYLIGIFWADNTGEGLREIEKRLVLLIFPVCFFLLKDGLSENQIQLVLHFFILFCVCLSLICYGHALGLSIEHGSFKVVETLEREYYYFSYLYLTSIIGIDPIYLSLYVNFSILLLLYRPFKSRILSMFLVIYLSIFVFLVASKIGVIFLAVIFVIFMYEFVSNKYLFFGLGIAASFIFIASIYFSPFLKDRFFVSTEYNYEWTYSGSWNSISQRLAIWDCAVEAAKGNFLTGNGTGDGQKMLEEVYLKNKYTRGYEDHYNAHNEFLYTYLDIGLLGVIALLGIFLWPITIRMMRKEKLFICFLIEAFFYFSVEVVLARRVGVIFFTFFYSLLLIDSLGRNKKLTNV